MTRHNDNDAQEDSIKAAAKQQTQHNKDYTTTTTQQ